MSAEVVNLRQARKARERRAREETAQANRLAHGVAKATRKLTDAQKKLEAAKLDAHRREPAREP